MAKYRTSLRNDIELSLENFLFQSTDDIIVAIRFLEKEESTDFQVRLWRSEFDEKSSGPGEFREVSMDQPPGFGQRTRPPVALDFILEPARQPGAYRLELVQGGEVVAETQFLVLERLESTESTQ